MARSKLAILFLALVLVPSMALSQAVSTGVVTKPAPLNGTQIAGRDASGNLQVPRVDSSGKLSTTTAIDQTAPGTSNLVATSGTRLFVARFASPIANTTASYATNKVVGGLITIPTGLPPGTIMIAFQMRLRTMFSDLTTAASLNYQFFDANPTASTFTDGATPALAAADLPKSITQGASAWLAGAAGGFASNSGASTRITVDASGNIYCVIVTQGTLLFANANALLVEIDGTY